MFVFGAALLCTILPSQVAFTSLISAGGVPTIAAYGLIGLLRLTMTPNHFKNSHFYLGKLRLPFYLATTLFNGLVFAVSSALYQQSMKPGLLILSIMQVMISPFYFPVDAESFNFACVIFGAVTVFALLSWYFTPAEKWLRQEQINAALREADGLPPASDDGTDNVRND